MGQKIFKMLVLAAVLGSSVSAQAASVNRFPSAGKDSGFSTAARADVILNRKDEDADEYDMNTYEGEVGYQFNDRVRVYATAGVAKIEYDDLDTESDSDLIVGLGSTLRLYKSDSDIALDIDAKYKYMNTDFVYAAAPSFPIDTDIHEWQAALTVSKTFKIGEDSFGDAITPYLGVKYNDFVANGELLGITDDYSSDKVVGVYGGVDFAFTDAVSFGIEGRFIDETAVTADVTYRF